VSENINNTTMAALTKEEIITIADYNDICCGSDQEGRKSLRKAEVSLGQMNKLDKLRRLAYKSIEDPPQTPVVLNPSAAPAASPPIITDPVTANPGDTDAVLLGMTKATISSLRSHPELESAGKLWGFMSNKNGGDPLLDNLLTDDTKSNQNFSEKNNTPVQTPLAPDDPRAILYMRATSVKCIHITSFLSEETKKRLKNKKSISLFQQGSHIVPQLNEAESYAGVGIFEYFAANNRLLNFILENGILPRDQIEYYLAYSTYICELAEKHPWDLVLDFDFRYRERQAQLQFPWGSRVSSLDLALLGGSNHRGNARTDTPPAPAPNRKKQLCHDFKMNGYCEFGNKCRYKHWPPAPGQT